MNYLSVFFKKYSSTQNTPCAIDSQQTDQDQIYTSEIRTSALSKDFLKKIEASNQEKKRNAPLAVVLMGSNDLGGVFSLLSNQHIFLNAAKTHKIAIKILDKGSELGDKIRESSRENRKPIDLLFVNAHGNNERIRFGNSLYTEKDVTQKDFSALTPKATIILNSCLTGNSIAQKIADISKRIVLAPKENACPITTFFTMSGDKPLILYYNWLTAELHTHIFTPKTPSKPMPFDINLFKNLLIERSDYLQQLSFDCPKAHAELGLLSISPMGLLIYGGRKNEEALGHIVKAAEKGDCMGQYYLGSFYLKGRYGLQKSDKTALKWIRLAANQGYAHAQAMLGHFYMQGSGRLQKSNTEALKWVRLAADQAYPGTQAMLDSLTPFLQLSPQNNTLLVSE